VLFFILNSRTSWMTLVKFICKQAKERHEMPRLKMIFKTAVFCKNQGSRHGSYYDHDGLCKVDGRVFTFIHIFIHAYSSSQSSGLVASLFIPTAVAENLQQSLLDAVNGTLFPTFLVIIPRLRYLKVGFSFFSPHMGHSRTP
jgi:hypothetical protein